MAQAIFVAILSGLTAALLSGLLTPGSIPLFLLFFLAPAPLMIAGLGWHALVAALGALVGLVLVNSVIGFRGAIGFIGMVGLPSVLACFVFAKLFDAPVRLPRDGERLGQLYMLLSGYVALAIIGSAISVAPDYEALQAGLRATMSEASRFMRAGAMLPQADEAALEAVIDTMAGLILPISALMILITLVVSGTLALKIVERAKGNAFIAPDLRHLRLPGGAILLLGLSLFMAMDASYIGIFAGLIAVGLGLGYVLQGFGVLHFKLGGKPGGTMLIGLTWLITVLFGFPALGFLVLGMLDHLLNFRNNRAES
jgi:Predicted membrane protein (DUF2232)